MKTVKFPLVGRTRHLAFTVEAMFQLDEQFGSTQGLVDAVQNGGREGFAAACRVAAILAEQGELARRSLGYDPEPIAGVDEIMASMSPSDMIALKLAIPAAISLGYGREVEPENDEVDLGLAELNAQKKHGDPRPLHSDGDGLWAVQKGRPPLLPGGGGRPLGAVSKGSWGEAETRL